MGSWIAIAAPAATRRVRGKSFKRHGVAQPGSSGSDPETGGDLPLPVRGGPRRSLPVRSACPEERPRSATALTIAAQRALDTRHPETPHQSVSRGTTSGCFRREKGGAPHRVPEGVSPAARSAAAETTVVRPPGNGERNPPFRCARADSHPGLEIDLVGPPPFGEWIEG